MIFPSPLTASVAVLARDHIDTDQIIPARFLKTTCKEGLGAHAFHDWRYDEAGTPRPDFALNQPAAAGAEVLVAGANFGCGSSREHAPWALRQVGFRVVVASSFAEIFEENALKNALLPLTLPAARLAGLQAAGSGARVTVDLAAQVLTLPDGGDASFPLEPFRKRCLLLGLDELELVLGQEAELAAYEARRPPVYDTRALGGGVAPFAAAER